MTSVNVDIVYILFCVQLILGVFSPSFKMLAYVCLNLPFHDMLQTRDAYRVSLDLRIFQKCPGDIILTLCDSPHGSLTCLDQHGWQFAVADNRWRHVPLPGHCEHTLQAACVAGSIRGKSGHRGAPCEEEGALRVDRSRERGEGVHVWRPF